MQYYVAITVFEGRYSDLPFSGNSLVSLGCCASGCDSMHIPGTKHVGASCPATTKQSLLEMQVGEWRASKESEIQVRLQHVGGLRPTTIG